MPGPKYGHWLFGQVIPIITEEVAFPEMRWHKEHGPRIRFMGPFGSERVSFTTHTALKQILVERPYDFPKPHFLKHVLGVLAGYGLLTHEGKDHADLRRFMNNAFAFKHIEQQFEAYNRHIDGLLDVFRTSIAKSGNPEEQGSVIEVTRPVNACLLDIICSTGFGYETDHLHNPEETLGKSYEIGANMQNGVNMAALMLITSLPGGNAFLRYITTHFWATWVLQKLSDNLGIFGFGVISRLALFTTHMYRINTVAQDMLDTKLAESKKLMAAGDTQGGKIDVLSLLVKASVDPSSSYKMDAQQIQAQVLTFLGAGHETTASGMAWVLWELAKNQRVQKKLRTECQELLMRVEHPQYQDIKHLTYLDAVINEILRLRPPTPATARTAAEDCTIDGIFIPKGTMVYIPNRVVNTDTKFWGEDAMEFRPERWENLPEGYSSTFSMLTFIAGAHHCIGERMARNEMKAVLCALCANFEFSPKNVDQTVKVAAAITMKPDGGLELLVRSTKMGATQL